MNIQLISVTLFVINEDKLIDFKDKQFWNIASIFLTLIVFNDDKFIDSKDDISENIPHILVMLYALKVDKSIDFKEQHLKNINAVDVNNFLNLNLTCINPVSLLLYFWLNSIFLLFINIYIFSPLIIFLASL